MPPTAAALAIAPGPNVLVKYSFQRSLAVSGVNSGLTAAAVAPLTLLLVSAAGLSAGGPSILFVRAGATFCHNSNPIATTKLRIVFLSFF
jgi:hypothetical protein